MQSGRFAPFSPACDDTSLKDYNPPPSCNIDWLKVPRTMCGISRGLQVRRNCWFAWLLRGPLNKTDWEADRSHGVSRWSHYWTRCHLFNSPGEWDAVCVRAWCCTSCEPKPLSASWTRWQLRYSCVCRSIWTPWKQTPHLHCVVHSFLYQVTTLAILYWQNPVCGYLKPLLSLTPAVLTTKRSEAVAWLAQPISNSDTWCMSVFIKHRSGWLVTAR